MKILVLGGTRFVGRAIVEAALARGHEVTAVSRGVSGEPTAGVTWVRADRTEPGALRALADQSWDAVLDTWSDDPAAVADAASTLADSAAWFGYVSSRSVYRWPMVPGSDETAPVVDPDDENPYAVNKRASELSVLEHFDGRCVIARAGLILGPYEDVGRLTWWLDRAAVGGPIVAPEPPDQVWQLIDARDLAGFVLRAATKGLSGTFNLVSPRAQGFTTKRLVDACVATTGGVAEPVWVAPQLLERAGVEPWDDLPGWIPPGNDAAGLHDGDVAAAVAAGLTCRPIEDTVADTWAWMQSVPPARRRTRQSGPRTRGLSAAQEQSIWWLVG